MRVAALAFALPLCLAAPAGAHAATYLCQSTAAHPDLGKVHVFIAVDDRAGVNGGRVSWELKRQAASAESTSLSVEYELADLTAGGIGRLRSVTSVNMVGFDPPPKAETAVMRLTAPEQPALSTPWPAYRDFRMDVLRITDRGQKVSNPWVFRNATMVRGDGMPDAFADALDAKLKQAPQTLKIEIVGDDGVVLTGGSFLTGPTALRDGATALVFEDARKKAVNYRRDCKRGEIRMPGDKA